MGQGLLHTTPGLFHPPPTANPSLRPHYRVPPSQTQTGTQRKQHVSEQRSWVWTQAAWPPSPQWAVHTLKAALGLRGLDVPSTWDLQGSKTQRPPAPIISKWQSCAAAHGFSCSANSLSGSVLQRVVLRALAVGCSGRGVLCAPAGSTPTRRHYPNRMVP